MNVQDLARFTFKEWEEVATPAPGASYAPDSVWCPLCAMTYGIREIAAHRKIHRKCALDPAFRGRTLANTTHLHGKLIVPWNAADTEGVAVTRVLRRFLNVEDAGGGFPVFALCAFVRENVKLIQGARVYLRAHGKLDDRPVCFSMNPEDVRFLHGLFIAGMQYEEIQAIYRNMAHQKRENAA